MSETKSSQRVVTESGLKYRIAEIDDNMNDLQKELDRLWNSSTFDFEAIKALYDTMVSCQLIRDRAEWDMRRLLSNTKS
jgi:hypothetical protein